MSPLRLLGTVFVTALAATAVGCSSGADGSVVAVTGTDQGCTPASDVIDAGEIDFEFTNEADRVSELYVLRSNGDIVGEVENVTTGLTRTLTVDLVAGDYTLRCRPGQTGTGYTTDITVSGRGGEPVQSPDRTLSFEAVDFDYSDLDLSDVTAGETIRFEMTNSGDQDHEFEVLDPDGDPIGEVPAVGPGGTAGATITFDVAGEYTYQCILIDPATGERHTVLGMTGTFTVS